MFSLFFIDRPIVAKVISIFIVLVGIIALYELPVAQFPQIVPPTIQVKANYAGGSAEIVEKLLTAPMEEQLNGVEGMIYMESTSASDGSSTIKVYFDLDTDLDIAAVDVQNRVSLALPTLPAEVKQKGVSTKKVSSSMLLMLSLTSSNPKHDTRSTSLKSSSGSTESRMWLTLENTVMLCVSGLTLTNLQPLG